MQKIDLRLLAVAVPLALSACAYPEPVAATPASAPVGVDLGPSKTVVLAKADASAGTRADVIGEGHERATAQSQDHQVAHDGHRGTHAKGVVNSVDPAGHKMNITHEPIPEIGWPTMTMDFAVAPSVDLKGVKPGSRVNFTLERGKDGMYEVRSVEPAGGAR